MRSIRDPNGLLELHYRTAVNLGNRLALHDRFGTGQATWFSWLFDLLPQKAELDILEVGCGTGRLWKDNLERIPAGWRLTLSDLSTGMLEQAQASLSRPALDFVRADVHDLEFADDAFDVVVANHMLYHLEDLDRGLAELRRVLRPGGTLLAATNGPDHMQELWQLIGRCLPALQLDHPPDLSFRLDNGADLLAPHFDRVERRDRSSDLWVTEAKPLVAYMLSTMTVQAAGLSERVVMASTDRLWDEAEARISADGGILIHRQSGVFLAR